MKPSFSLLWSAFLTSLLLCTPEARADQIELMAGGTEEALPAPAVKALLKEPFGTGFDGAGNLFIIEMASGNRLLKVDLKRTLTHVAGTGATGFAGDGGPALEAQFNGPHNLAVLPDGNVLIADTWNGRVRKIDVASGKVSTLPGFSVPSAQAKAAGPYCIALDFTGTKLYVADLKRVHVVDLKTGQSKVVAGNGSKGIPMDGAMAVDAPLVDPRAVAADRKGNVYILERNGNALRVVSPDGKIKTVVNASGKKGAEGDGGDALQATMNGPKHLCVDLEDNVIIADAENHIVRKYVPATGKILRVAGTGKKGTAGLGGPPEKCELNRPHGVTVAKDGTLFITDSYNNRILKVTKGNGQAAAEVLPLIQMEDTPLKEAVKELSRQAGITFEMAESVAKLPAWQLNVTFRMENLTAKDVLCELLDSYGMKLEADPADASKVRIVLGAGEGTGDGRSVVTRDGRTIVFGGGSEFVGGKSVAEVLKSIPHDSAPVGLIEFKEAPLLDVIKVLARQAGFNVMLAPPASNLSKVPVSLRQENTTAKQTLQKVLEDHKLSIWWNGKIAVVSTPPGN